MAINAIGTVVVFGFCVSSCSAVLVVDSVNISQQNCMEETYEMITQYDMTLYAYTFSN